MPARRAEQAEQWLKLGGEGILYPLFNNGFYFDKKKPTHFRVGVDLELFLFVITGYHWVEFRIHELY